MCLFQMFFSSSSIWAKVDGWNYVDLKINAMLSEFVSLPAELLSWCWWPGPGQTAAGVCRRCLSSNLTAVR